MRGTLHGDFSRGPTPGGREDRVVHLQQGRVLLDADWNAQAAWIHRRIETAVADLLGSSGGPADQAGFGIEVQPVLDFGGRRFAVIGGAGGLELPGVEAEALGLTLELRLSAARDGAIVSLGRLGGSLLWSWPFTRVGFASLGRGLVAGFSPASQSTSAIACTMSRSPPTPPRRRSILTVSRWRLRISVSCPRPARS